MLWCGIGDWESQVQVPQWLPTEGRKYFHADFCSHSQAACKVLWEPGCGPSNAVVLFPQAPDWTRQNPA